MTKFLAGISLLIGVASVSFPVLAEQQTLRTCREEWRANQAALRANGMTQKAYIADCEAHAAKVGAASAAPASADTRKNPTAATAGPQSPSEQCWQAGSDGWTVICSTPVTSGTCATGNANGTCIFYVSATGNDRNDCRATSTPCRTLAKGMSKMRNGKPDWLLLKEGDTFTDQSFGCVLINGASATGPLLFGSYDPATPTIGSPGTGGARPIVKPNPAAPASNSRGIGSCGGGPRGANSGDFVAVVGIDFYNYTRDPANIGAGFDASTSTIGGTAFQNGRSFLLLENNVFGFFGDGINMDATDTNVPVTGVTIVRRNIVVDSWSPTGHSQGMHFTFNYGTSVFEENLFDHNGWNETLIVPASATFNIVASTVTWSSSIPLFNGTSITLHDNGDTLPTGLSFNTRYRVLNYSAGTFQLSTDGVNPITLSGTQSGTHLLAWDYPGASAQADTFNHGVYMDSDNDPVIFRGNIITNSSNVGIQIRPGGQIYENLNSLNPSAGFAASSSSTVYNNVTIEGKGHTCNVPCPAQSDGLQIIASNGSTMTKNLTVNAFAGISASSAMAVKNSQDDCGRVHFTIANPTLVTWTTQRVFTHGAVQFASCGGTLPANVSLSTTYYTSNNTVAGQAGPPTTANISLTDGGALISTAGNAQTDGFSPVFISINNVLTGNTIYNWGDATGNANIVSLAGNTTSPNTNFNAGGGNFPDPTRSIGSYNAQIAGCASLPGGCTATTAAFLTSARAQRKGNWNNTLMAPAVNNYIPCRLRSVGALRDTFQRDDVVRRKFDGRKCLSKRRAAGAPAISTSNASGTMPRASNGSGMPPQTKSRSCWFSTQAARSIAT